MLAGFVSVEDVEKKRKRESLEAEKRSLQPKIEAEEARLSKLLDEAKQVFAKASVQSSCPESMDRAELLLQKLMEEPLLLNSSPSESLHIKRLKVALFSTYGLLKEEKGEHDKALSLYSKTLCVVSECEDSEIISEEELVQLYRCIAMVARLSGKTAVCKFAAEAGLKMCPSDWRFDAELLYAQSSIQDVESARKQEEKLKARLPRAFKKRLFSEMDSSNGACWWKKVLKWRKSESADGPAKIGDEHSPRSKQGAPSGFENLEYSKGRLSVFSSLLTALDAGEITGTTVFSITQETEAQADETAKPQLESPEIVQSSHLPPQDPPSADASMPPAEQGAAPPVAVEEEDVEEGSQKDGVKQTTEETSGGQQGGSSSNPGGERKSTRKSARLAMADQQNVEPPQPKPSAALDTPHCLKWLNSSNAMIADVLKVLEKHETKSPAHGKGVSGDGAPAPSDSSTAPSLPRSAAPVKWDDYRGKPVFSILRTLLSEIQEMGDLEKAAGSTRQQEADQLAAFDTCLKTFVERYNLPASEVLRSNLSTIDKNVGTIRSLSDLLGSLAMGTLADKPLGVLAATFNECGESERKDMFTMILAISRYLARKGESVTAKALILSAASMLPSLSDGKGVGSGNKEESAWGYEELLRCWEDAKNPDYYADALKADDANLSERYEKMSLICLWNEFKEGSAKEKKRVVLCINALLKKLRLRQQNLEKGEAGETVKGRKIVFSTMELEALLTLLSQETNGLEAFYGSIDSATTDTAAREVDLWKTLDKHCSALAKVLQKICNCLDEVLPYLPFPPEDTAASSEKMPKALSPSVFSSVVAQALQAMAKVLKNAFSIPGSMKDSIRRLDLKSKRLDKFRDMECESATGLLLSYHALQVQTGSTDPSTSLTIVENLHSLLAEVGLCRIRNSRWCSTFYEADKSEIKDRDSDEDKLDSIATKHREMQDAITQARRQINLIRQTCLSITNMHEPSRQVFYCLYNYNICLDDEIDNHDNFSSEHETKPALPEGGEADQEAARKRLEAMADIFKYDLQPLAENEDLRRKSKEDVRQALAEIANHFPLPLDEIRPVLDSILEYLNLGCIEDKQVSSPLYSPWVKTPIERLIDTEQEDTGKWRALLLDRSDAPESLESDKLFKGIYSSQAKINSSLLNDEEFFLNESARGDVANSTFNFGVSDVNKFREWSFPVASKIDNAVTNSAKQSQGRRRLFSSFLEDCSASIGDGRRSHSVFDVQPASTLTESFKHWSKVIYLCDSSYELEAILVAAVATNPSSWTEWRQMAGLYTLLMDVLLSDSAKMFSRVEILEKPFFIEILERVRRRSNRSFLMCHRLLCKELQKVQSSSSGDEKKQQQQRQEELYREIWDVESQYAANIFERLQNIPPLYDCNNLGPKKDTESYGENIRASLNVYNKILSRVMLAFPKQFLAAELDLSVSVSKDHTALETTSADCDEVAWEGPFYVGKLLGKLNSQTEEFIVIVSNRTEILRHFACSTEIGDGRGKGQLEPFYRLHASRLKMALQTLSDLDDDDMIGQASNAKTGELLREFLQTLMKFTFDVPKFKGKLVEELKAGVLPQDECILRCVSWDAVDALDYAFRFKDSHNVQMYRAQYRKAMGLLELNESETGVDMALDCLKGLFFNTTSKKEASAGAWTSLKMDKIRMWELNDLPIKKDNQKEVQRNDSVDHIQLPFVDELDSTGAAPLQEATFLPGNWQKDNVVMQSQGRREVSYKYVSAVLRALYAFAALLAAKGRVHTLVQLCEGLYFIMKKDTMSWACLFDAYTRARGLCFLCLNWNIRKSGLSQRGALLYHACRTFVQHHTRWNDLISEAMDAAMNLPKRIERGVGGAKWVWEKIYQMQSIVSLNTEEPEDQHPTLLEFKEYAMDYIFDLESTEDFAKIEKEYNFLKATCKSAKLTSNHTREYGDSVQNCLARALSTRMSSLTKQLQEKADATAMGGQEIDAKDDQSLVQDCYKSLFICVQTAKALYKGDAQSFQSKFDALGVKDTLLEIAKLVSYGTAEESGSGQDSVDKLYDELMKRLKKRADEKPEVHNPEPVQVLKDANEEASVIDIS